MSYTFAFRVKDGNLSEPQVNGDLPDGEYVIGGHEDRLGASVHVTHKMLNGMHIVEAQHYSARHNYDPERFQETKAEEAAPRPPYYQNVTLPGDNLVDTPMDPDAREMAGRHESGKLPRRVPADVQDPSEAEVYSTTDPVADILSERSGHAHDGMAHVHETGPQPVLNDEERPEGYVPNRPVTPEREAFPYSQD